MSATDRNQMLILRTTANPRHRGSSSDCGKPGTGFTLVELLVVISLIVLLVSILLPVVQKAEKVAHQAVCSSNLRQIATGVSIYAAEQKGYMPGPNTSGLALLQSPTPSDSRAIARPSNPVTPDDWVSPTFGPQWGLRGTDRGDKLKNILDREELRCPANDFRYQSRTGPFYSQLVAISKITIASYSMPYAMHAYASSADTPPSGGFYLSAKDRSAIDLSNVQNSFKVDSLGSPSGKVLAADGANEFIGEDNLNLDATYGSRGEGGLPNGGPFMSRGATLGSNPIAGVSTPYLQQRNFDPGTLSPLVEKITYRHQGAINIAYWDGHVAAELAAESRDAHRWFPSGAVVKTNFFLGDPSVRRGDVIR